MTQCIEDGLLQAYIDDELPPTDRERVQAHLASCPACTTRAGELRTTTAYVADLLATYTEGPDAHTALATAMQAASLAPVPTRVAGNVPTTPATVAARRNVPRRGWGMAMVGFGVAAVMLLAFWLSGMFQAASSPADDSQFSGVPADPLSRPAGVGTPEDITQTLKSFVPQGKVRHLVLEEVEEGTSQQKVIEEVWLINGTEHPLLYRTVSPYGDWQLVGSDAVWTYLGQRPAVQGRITRLIDGTAGADVIVKTAFDSLHFDRIVASDRSINDILSMPGATTTVTDVAGRAATLLEYSRDNALRTWPNAGRTPIAGFSSLSTDGDALLGWQPRRSVQDPNSGLTFKVAPSTPELIYLPPFPTPTASPVLRVDIPDGGWQVIGPEIVECRIWLDKNTNQVLRQTTTRRLSGIKMGDNGTPVPVEQTIVQSRNLVVDELLDPSEVLPGMFEIDVPDGYRVLELGHTFARPVPAEPTPAFVATVTPIPYVGAPADPESQLTGTVSPVQTGQTPRVSNPPGVPFGDTGWYLFTHPEGLFEVLFPRAMVDIGGHNDTSEYGVKDGSLTYMVTYRPITTMQLGADPDAWLDSELPAIVTSLSGILRDQRPLPVSKGVARELTIERHDGRFTRSRVYLSGGHLYNVFAIAEEEKALSGDEVIRYLDSFKLLNP